MSEFKPRDENERPALEFSAIAPINVFSDSERRDVLIAFEGDHHSEESNMVVRLGAGSIPALAVMLHKAGKELDKTATATTEVATALALSRVHALQNSMKGHCILQLEFLDFQIPLVMPKEVALSLIAETYKALETVDSPRPKRRLS